MHLFQTIYQKSVQNFKNFPKSSKTHKMAFNSAQMISDTFEKNIV